MPNDGVKLHLSRMMCPAHLHETIGKIKTLLKDGLQPIVRVIATQLVEAGVDIDFRLCSVKKQDSILYCKQRDGAIGKDEVPWDIHLCSVWLQRSETPSVQWLTQQCSVEFAGR